MANKSFIIKPKWPSQDNTLAWELKLNLNDLMLKLELIIYVDTAFDLRALKIRNIETKKCLSFLKINRSIFIYF